MSGENQTTMSDDSLGAKKEKFVFLDEYAKVWFVRIISTLCNFKS